MRARFSQTQAFNLSSSSKVTKFVILISEKAYIARSVLVYSLRFCLAYVQSSCSSNIVLYKFEVLQVQSRLHAKQTRNVPRISAYLLSANAFPSIQMMQIAQSSNYTSYCAQLFHPDRIAKRQKLLKICYTVVKVIRSVTDIFHYPFHFSACCENERYRVSAFCALLSVRFKKYQISNYLKGFKKKK